MLKMRQYKELKWSYQEIFTLLRSAGNIFLIEALGELHELKKNMLENEEYIISNIEERILKRRKGKS